MMLGKQENKQKFSKQKKDPNNIGKLNIIWVVN